MPFGIQFVHTASVGLRETFGKYTKTVGPGLRFYIPGIQRIVPISNKLQQADLTFYVKTKDNSFTSLDIAVQYRIKEQDSAKAFYSMENPIRQIKSYVENTVRSKTPTMTLDEMYEDSHNIEQIVSEQLSKKMQDYGYVIENTLVKSIEPSKEIREAMNQINASERMKQATKNTADAKYIEKIREAEADRDRKRLQGEGISQQRRAILKGYESGIDEMANKFGLTPQDVINFVMRTQYLDTMESIGKSTNAKTVFLNHAVDKMMTANEISQN
jgi:regulator of protease activity HflC (stomatin/prohibitin superfamily)